MVVAREVVARGHGAVGCVLCVTVLAGDIERPSDCPRVDVSVRLRKYCAFKIVCQPMCCLVYAFISTRVDVAPSLQLFVDGVLSGRFSPSRPAVNSSSTFERSLLQCMGVVVVFAC